MNWNLIQNKLALFINGHMATSVDLSTGTCAAPAVQIVGACRWSSCCRGDSTPCAEPLVGLALATHKYLQASSLNESAANDQTDWTRDPKSHTSMASIPYTSGASTSTDPFSAAAL